TLNIGYYDRIRDYYTSERKDSTGKNISYLVDYFFLDYHSDRAKAFFADTIYARTKTMLKCYEKLFGVYPFARDGYALVETPYWGMEHQSAVAYGNNFKLNNFGFDFILIHESAHEWWGNAVSCNDPADMWIHESFTTYTEALFVEYLYGYKRSLEYLSMQKPNIANKTPIQGPRGVNFHERADNDIYYKGSWMLHTLRSVLDNDSLWFGMLYGLQQEFKYKTISTEDVTKYIEKYTNRNLEAFFRQYIYGNKLPTLQYFVEKKNGKNVLKYRWINAVTGFEMPIDIYVKDKKYRLIPKSTYQTLNVENDAIKVNTERFLIEVLNQK
ncbi:MAG: M1 family peptidase, partial [Sphingobacteriales bacterium]